MGPPARMARRFWLRGTAVTILAEAGYNVPRNRGGYRAQHEDRYDDLGNVLAAVVVAFENAPRTKFAN